MSITFAARPRASFMGSIVAALLAAPMMFVGATQDAFAAPDGCSGPFRNRSAIMTGQQGLEVVHQLSARPGNPAIAPNGRMFITMHPFDAPQFNVVEVKRDGSLVPYPSPEWSAAPTSPTDARGISAAIGIWASPDCKLYVLDLGGPNNSSKLVAWDISKDRLDRVYYMPQQVLQPNSLNQDFALDTERMQLYVADMTRGDLIGDSNPAIIVVDLETGAARRVLENDPRFQPDDQPTVINGVTLALQTDAGDQPLFLGLNPIAIDSRNDWVYFGAISGTTVYRIRSRDLANPQLTQAQLADRIEEYGPKNHSDGIAVDNRGNVYVTDLSNNSIGITSKGSSSVLATDDQFINWPDGLAFSRDGYLYVAVNQLHLGAALHGGVELGDGNFYIVRVRPLASGLPPGRRVSHGPGPR